MSLNNSNYSARQSLNKQYSDIKGARSIDEVATGFGKGWLVFAVLSAMASAFSFYQDFNQSLGIPITIIIVVVLAVALEFFKHLSIKGIFSDMNLVSKGLVSFAAIGLIGISFYTHYKSIQVYQKNMVTDDLKTEIRHQRYLQKVQNGQIASILETNSELAKAINNGNAKDDEMSTNSQISNNMLIKTLSELSAKNNMTNTSLLLSQSRNTAKTTASAILIIFIMVEIMALFSILSKIIIVDNVDENVKNLVSTMDKLDEVQGNVYAALTEQKIQQTEQRMGVALKKQEEEHQEELKKIGTVREQPRASTAPLPSLPMLSTGEKGQVWSNANCDHPTLPTGITKIHGENNGNVFFKGTADNFTDAYEGDGFKVEKYPLVPRKQKKTRIVKEKGAFKILENPSRDTEEETEFKSEKVNNFGFDEDFISAEEWERLSEHSRALALSYVDMSMFDAVEEVPMIQIMFENGLINKYDEPLLKKTEAVQQYKNMKGGTLQDARDIYVKVAEKLEKQDKIVRRSRYHNRCQGINIGTVTIG